MVKEALLPIYINHLGHQFPSRISRGNAKCETKISIKFDQSLYLNKSKNNSVRSATHNIFVICTLLISQNPNSILTQLNTWAKTVNNTICTF